MQTILQRLQKYLVLVQSYFEDTRLQTRVPETEHLKTAKILEFQNSTALNLVSSI